MSDKTMHSNSPNKKTSGQSIKYKQCIACGEDIPIQAKICNKCNSHQLAWKNHLSYLANVIGVFSVVIGAVAFIVSSIPDIRKVIAWNDEVKILTFSSDQPFTITNVGDGPVYVYSIDVKVTKPSGYTISYSYYVNQYIEPGELVTKGESYYLGDYKGAISTDPEEIEMLLNKANVLGGSNPPNDCVVMIFEITEDPGYLSAKSFLGKSLITYDVEAFVRFFSIKKREYKNQDVPMIATLQIPKDPNRACSTSQ